MISEILNTPAPLTAEDALKMCIASAFGGAVLVVVLLLVWIWAAERTFRRRRELERQASRTVLHKV